MAMSDLVLQNSCDGPRVAVLGGGGQWKVFESWHFCPHEWTDSLTHERVFAPTGLEELQRE